jgi:hypothetical protein
VGSSSRKRTTAKDGELVERVRGLEERLAVSVSRPEFETFKSNTQLEINDLQTRLSDSIQRADFEYVKKELRRISELGGRTSRIPTEETEELGASVTELEKLPHAIPGSSADDGSGLSAPEIQAPVPELSEPPGNGDLSAAKIEESAIEEEQQALSQSKKGADALREKMSEMGPSTGDSEESESTDSEDTEDSEKPEPEESPVQS